MHKQLSILSMHKQQPEYALVHHFTVQQMEK